ncbi:hypothetical protein HN604_00610 [archaeon]|jgi:hypothetical protein|nr:hypothetical protein [archaeon]MBT6182541.1 hypothetical protein [archaeon]MBT6606746.1 hypothetical protein [archaeon]MBT7251304.1 hypothetical protein [archaeon]MBT7660567.1 hypothetical protein [archaeon]
MAFEMRKNRLARTKTRCTLFANARGQVAIFIIVAIVIVAGILFLFLFLGRVDVEDPLSVNPTKDIQLCVEDGIQEVVVEILANGGIYEPEHTFAYDGENYTYLCYQDADYLPCYNSFPGLETVIENEIYEQSKDRVDECFDLVGEDLERQGFLVEFGPREFSVDIFKSRIFVTLNRPMTLTHEETIRDFEVFDIEIISDLGSLVDIAREIINYEAQYCFYDYHWQMRLTPEININFIDFQTNKLYELENRVSHELFKFAVRSCPNQP